MVKNEVFLKRLIFIHLVNAYFNFLEIGILIVRVLMSFIYLITKTNILKMIIIIKYIHS